MGAQNLGGGGEKPWGTHQTPFSGASSPPEEAPRYIFPWDLKCGGGSPGVGVHLPQFWRL